MTDVRPIGLKEYFRESLTMAAERLQVTISEHTEFYLVDLLSRYAHADAMNDSNITNGHQTFGQLYLASAGCSGDHRATILKYIGDTTLFMTGFFSDSLQRSLVDIDYYAELGRTSYLNLLDLFAARVIQWRISVDVFDELSANFCQFMDLLAEISGSDGASGDEDLLRLYERWLRTGSRRDETRLRERGLIPTASTSPKVLQ